MAQHHAQPGHLPAQMKWSGRVQAGFWREVTPTVPCKVRRAAAQRPRPLDAHPRLQGQRQDRKPAASLREGPLAMAEPCQPGPPPLQPEDDSASAGVWTWEKRNMGFIPFFQYKSSFVFNIYTIKHTRYEKYIHTLLISPLSAFSTLTRKVYVQGPACQPPLFSCPLQPNSPSGMSSPSRPRGRKAPHTQPRHLAGSSEGRLKVRSSQETGDSKLTLPEGNLLVGASRPAACIPEMSLAGLSSALESSLKVCAVLDRSRTGGPFLST